MIRTLLLMLLGWNSADAFANTRPRFDVNDVSLMFPAPQSKEQLQTFLPLLNQTFVANNNLQTLLATVMEGETSESRLPTLAEWHVIAARLEPCFREDPNTTECIPQWRLVAQPLELGQNTVMVKDHAIHLIYQLTEAEGLELARGLYELKTENSEVSTNGQPLAFHPTIMKQGHDGAFAKGLRSLIRAFATESRLVEATVMLTISGNHWRFGRTLWTDGRLAPVEAPFAAAPFITLFGQKRPGLPGIENAIIPTPVSNEHLGAGVDSLEGGMFHELPATERDAVLASALRIDNPNVHTPATVDCVSCHMASRVLTRIHGKEFLTREDANPDRFVAEPGITTANATSEMELRHGYATRAFGYSFVVRGQWESSVTQRTINDSARAAAILNQRLGL